MVVADDLNDDWKPAVGAEPDGTMLRQATDPSGWNFSANKGVVNPSLIKHNGKYMLYCKSVVFPTPEAKKRKYVYGVAVSDRLEGPYQYHSKPVTPGNMTLEDAYAFSMDGSVYMLSRDFGGSKGNRGGGLLWKSKDGFVFNGKDTTRAYEDLAHYVGEESLRDANLFRGKHGGHLERAQVLFLDDQPAYLYLATGVNTTPDHGSCSHIFRIRKRQ